MVPKYMQHNGICNNMKGYGSNMILFDCTLFAVYWSLQFKFAGTVYESELCLQGPFMNPNYVWRDRL